MVIRQHFAQVDCLCNKFAYILAQICAMVKAQAIVTSSGTVKRNCLLPCPFSNVTICSGPSSGCGQLMDFQNNCAMLVYNCQKSARKFNYSALKCQNLRILNICSFNSRLRAKICGKMLSNNCITIIVIWFSLKRYKNV